MLMDASSLYSGSERRINSSSFVYPGKERRNHSRSVSSVDEHGLVRRAITRDRQAFGWLYDHFVDKIFKYIYYKVGSRSEAEDMTAQVFLKAWEAIDRYEWTDRPFSAWLYRIAHNLVVDYFRTRHESTQLEESGLDNPEDLDRLAEQHLTADILRHAVTRLTPDQQQVIILRFLEGFSTDQVAKIMGKQPGAVRTLQHRALAGLSVYMKRISERS